MVNEKRESKEGLEGGLVGLLGGDLRGRGKGLGCSERAIGVGDEANSSGKSPDSSSESC